jgi:hypothetical protein
LNDEGGVIAGHVEAYNGVHEASGKGSLHAHLQIWSAICPALLQGTVDMQEVCDVISETLDSMICATLPREYHVKDLIERELPFYPTKGITYDKTIRRGRMMIVPPDPKDIKAFNDYFNTTIIAIGIHSHNKRITGRCHKPPKGLTHCSLTKPSGLIDKTKAIQLIDITKPPSKPSEKVVIDYIATDEIQPRHIAEKSIPPQNRIGPMFPEVDPRLIVYQPK